MTGELSGPALYSTDPDRELRQQPAGVCRRVGRRPSASSARTRRRTRANPVASRCSLLLLLTERIAAIGPAPASRFDQIELNVSAEQAHEVHPYLSIGDAPGVPKIPRQHR
jgi:hypothetical protein